MRASLPLTLSVSVAVHLCVAAGIALSFWHGSISFTSAPDATPPSTIVLHSEPAPVLPVPAITKAKAPIAEPVASVEPAIIPPLPKIEKAIAATTPAPAVAPEANPNAHVKALPPEAVLSPTPPPQLNGAHGVTFVVDISGSMYEPFLGSTRLAYARESLSRRIRSLKDGTPFAIVLYAQRACVSGPLVAASDVTRDAAIRYIMRDVDCGGGTNLPAGLELAAELRTGSVVVVSDGDLNIPAYTLAKKTRNILGPEGNCPALTVVAIAPRLQPGNDRLLQGLAEGQGGSYVAEQIDSDTHLLTAASGTSKPASATP